jgi:hypothetical protein
LWREAIWSTEDAVHPFLEYLLDRFSGLTEAPAERLQRIDLERSVLSAIGDERPLTTQYWPSQSRHSKVAQ